MYAREAKALLQDSRRMSKVRRRGVRKARHYEVGSTAVVVRPAGEVRRLAWPQTVYRGATSIAGGSFQFDVGIASTIRAV